MKTKHTLLFAIAMGVLSIFYNAFIRQDGRTSVDLFLALSMVPVICYLYVKIVRKEKADLLQKQKGQIRDADSDGN